MSYHDDQAREDAVKDEWKLIREQEQLANAKRQEAAIIAAWRRDHPEATCSDATVLALCAIEAVGRGPAPW